MPGLSQHTLCPTPGLHICQLGHDAMNGPVTCSEDIALLVFLWNHMPRCLKDYLWANGTLATENTGKLEPDDLKCTTFDLAVIVTRCFLRA
eukprot:895489-Pelagomonas_calceolata.AAC.1